MTTARATSSWRIFSRSSPSARTKPCSSASASPAARSASRPPAPRRGRVVERGGSARRLDRLERGGRAGEALPVHRALGGGEDPQHAAAFGRAAREPRRDEVGERSREGGAAELAPGRDQLLDDERRSRGPLGDEDHDRGGRPLAVDALDEPGDLAARERREVDADRRPQARLDHREVLAQLVLAGEPVGLVREHEADPLVARDPGHERGEGAGRGVGGVEVLERDDDRALGGDPAEPAEQRLERPRLAPLGVGEVAGPWPWNRGRALGDAGQAEEDRAGVPGEERIGLGDRAVGEQRADRVEHGRPRGVDRAVGLAAQHERRLRTRAEALDRLVQEPRRAHPGAARDDDGRRRAGRPRR